MQTLGTVIRAATAYILLPALAILAPPVRGQVNSAVRVLSTPNPAVVGQSVTFTAGVNWIMGAPPSGSITLSDTVTCAGTSAATVVLLGAVALGSSTSAAPGAGSLVVSFPCAGDNLIVGAYSGDSTYSPGTSQPLLETVLGQFASTNTTLASSPNPSTAGQSVTFGAAIRYVSANNSSPTGTVTFTDTTTGSVLGTVSVQTSGSRVGVGTAASIAVTSLTAGTHAIQASYSGDNVYGPSASQIVNQLVTPAGGGTTGGAPAIVKVVNAASYQPGIEAGSWVVIEGSNLANIADPGRTWRPNEIVNGQLPTSLDGVGVTIDGRPAFVCFISQHQINVQAPDDMARGPVAVVVTNNGSASAPATAQLQPYAPALFQWSATSYATTTRYSDGAIVGNPSAVTGSVSAKPGDTLILWGTGFGPTQPATPSGQLVTAASPTANMPIVTVGGVIVNVIGAAISPGTVGVYQIEIQLPQSIGLGDQPVVASVGGLQSAVGVNLFVANP